MEAFLDAFLKHERQEDLHRFRVQVKKIQALLIVAGCNGTRGRLIAIFKPVKKTFKQAGKLRNEYIRDALTTKRRHQQEAVRSFCALSERRRKHFDRVYRRLRNRVGRINGKAIRKFYTNELLYLAVKLTCGPSAGELHQCRSRIKVLLYNYPLVYNKLHFRLHIAYLDRLQEKIGNWHDRWLAGMLPGDNDGVRDFGARFCEQAIQRADQEHAPI